MSGGKRPVFLLGSCHMVLSSGGLLPDPFARCGTIWTPVPITLFALLVGSGLTLSASGRPADRIDREDRTVEERQSLAVDFADRVSALELIQHGVLPTKSSDWTDAKHVLSNMTSSQSGWSAERSALASRLSKSAGSEAHPRGIK